jgi:hypothetical protein
MINPGTEKSDAFVQKYDSGGRVRWTRFFGSTFGADAGSITVDPSGVTVAFNVAKDVTVSGFDHFLRKYSLNGKEIWTRSIPAAALLSATPAGYIYALVKESSFQLTKYDGNGTLHWTRPAALPRIAASSGAVYLAGSNSTEGGLVVSKYNAANGQLLFTKNIGADKPAWVGAVAADSKGVVAAGYTEAALAGTPNQGGGGDVFAIRVK